MKTILQLMVVFVGMALLGSAAAEHEGAVKPTDPVDGIIGDGAFNTFHPMTLTDPATQREQYSSGLLHVLSLLERRDLSSMPSHLREARRRNIERLREYRERGIFPVNYDHPGRILPCFIDSTGAICAAGYLIERSAGRQFAESINSRFKYATLAEIDSPALDRWIASSGLTRAEVATIQRPSVSSDGRVTGGPSGTDDLQRPARTSIAGAVALPPGVSTQGVNGFTLRGSIDSTARADSTAILQLE